MSGRLVKWQSHWVSRVLRFRVTDLSEEFRNLRGNELQMKMASHTLAPCRKTKPIILCSCLTDSSCCMLEKALKTIHLSHPSARDTAEPGEINRNADILAPLDIQGPILKFYGWIFIICCTAFSNSCCRF